MIINAANWARPAMLTSPDVEQQVKAMLHRIATQGDQVIEEYSLKYDQLTPKPIKLKSFGSYALPKPLATSIEIAAQRIECFARFQKQGLQSRQYADEYGCYGQRVSPIERIGAYIPGGRFPLISSALMTLIPATIAGSPYRIACSPSSHPAILAAASLAGATEFWQIGGVQAIAALAYGYQQLAPVDLIVGPGNAWVNQAKQQIQSTIKIDGVAGPSELLVICDGEQSIEWIALDAIAQAEHDPSACSVILSDQYSWLESMQDYLSQSEQMKSLVERQQIMLIYSSSITELVELAERFAPEHLMLCHKKVQSKDLSNYGSLFLGINSAIAMGDYISGPNHTLPTMGYARQNSGLNVATYLRTMSFQEINSVGKAQLAKLAMPIAAAEGLLAHYESLKVRL